MASTDERRLLRPRNAVGAVLGAALLVLLLLEIGAGRWPFGFSVAASVTNGLQVGSIFALVALGVALVYRATRVINFAQGELGSLPALLLLTVLLGGHLDKDLDLNAVNPWAFVGLTLAAMAVGALLAVAINLGVIQQLANAAPVTSLVATMGIALLAAGGELLAYDAQLRSFPRFVGGAPPGVKVGPLCFAQIDSATRECLPDQSFAIGGQTVTWHTLIILGVLAAVSVALALFFRSPAGVALLATAQEPFAAELYGISQRTMSSLAWAFAGAFGALAGVLASGINSLTSPAFMTSNFLVPGLVAAVLGGLTSMVGAVVGGLIIGVVFSVSTPIVNRLGWSDAVPGAPFVAVFAVLVLVLIVRPQGLFGKAA